MGVSKWDRLEPLAGKLVVQFDEPEEISRGGIYIPPAAMVNRDEAVVLAVGPGKFDANGIWLEPPVRVGDRVISSTAWGKTYTYIEDEKRHKVVLLSFFDVVAIVRTPGIERVEGE